MLIMCELRNANGLFGLKIRPWFCLLTIRLLFTKIQFFLISTSSRP